MKILIYAHQFPPTKGGMQYSNLEIARGLHNLGHKIEVIACRNRGIEKYISRLNFQVHILPKWPFATMYSLTGKNMVNWFFVLWYFLLIKRKIKEFMPDVIFVADETANCFWGTWAKRIDIPYVSYCSVPYISSRTKKSHNGNGLKKLKYLFENAIRDKFKSWLLISYLNAQKVLVVSKSTRREVIKVAPELSQKIDIVPRSVNDQFFTMPLNHFIINDFKISFNIKSEDLVLLSVCNVILNKGIDDVIRALSNMNNETDYKIKYLIVGDGPAYDYLKNLIERLNLDTNVIFKGEIPHKELIYYYDLCDIFILPSKRGAKESFGRVFAEAAARSKPSIGVADGGMVDVIDDGKTGFAVPVGDIKAIQNKIEYFILNRQKAKDFGENARIKAVKMYTSKAIALQLEQSMINVL